MKKIIYCTVCIIVVFAISSVSSYAYFSNTSSSSGQTSKVVANKPDSQTIDDQKDKQLGKNIEDRKLYPKEVFLTIDDGPSVSNTPKIIKTLKENDVKATFFMIGKNAEELPQIVRMVDDAGMCIGNHSYSHEYSCYREVDTCLNDFNKSQQILEKITNKNLPNIIRFPGGSDNQVSKANIMAEIRTRMVERGFFYVDWNISGEDAVSGILPSYKIVNNIINQCTNRNFVVILIHDAPDKRTTAEALPDIIKYLKDNGYVFRTFQDITPTEEKEMFKSKVLNRGLDKERILN